MAITKIEDLNIHKNPSTNTNNFDIENYLNANWNKIKEAVNNNADELTNLKTKNTQQDTNIQKNTEDIADINEKDTNQDKLIEELQNENERLNKTIETLKIKGQESGKSIHLTDSSDLECEISISGNAEQESGEGYNLLDTSNIEEKQYNGVDVTRNSNGSITLKGTATQDFAFTYSLEKILNGTYQESMKTVGTIDDSNGFLSSTIWNGVTVVFSDLMLKSNSTETFNKTFTEDTKITHAMFYVSANVILDCTVYPLLYKYDGTTKEYEQYGTSPSPNYPSEIETVGQNGSVEINVDNGLETTDSNYQSYTKTLPVQQEFAKIGDYEDTFVKVDGKWHEKHNIKKLILDGTENWSWHSDSFAFTQVPGISMISTKVLAISNFLLGIPMEKNGLYYTIKDNVIFSWVSGNLICLKATNKFSDVETLKVWLSEQYANGTPVVVYYVLSESELLECTSEQKTILNSFKTYKNVTNITSDSIATLNVTYIKDLETIINNLSQATI